MVPCLDQERPLHLNSIHILFPRGWNIFLYQNIRISPPLKLESDFQKLIFGDDGNEPLCFYFRKSNLPDTHPVQNKFLVFMTLFYKESDQELNDFYAYYRRQGVEHFYMYFNASLSSRGPLPSYPDVTYIEWDFPYFVNGRHHAQVPAINDYAKKYMHNFDYSILADIDEFIVCKDNLTVDQYLKKYKSSYPIWVPHYFSKVDTVSSEILFDPLSTGEFIRRRKTIYPGSFIQTHTYLNVHSVNASQMGLDILLFHNKFHIKNFNESKILLPQKR